MLWCISGTICNYEPLLLSIDKAIFTNGIILRGHITLYQTNDLQDVATIVSAFSAKGISIQSLNTSGNWLIVQTNEETIVQVNGIESF